MEAVSVVIPTHNRATLIEHTLNSVLAAMDPEDEIVVVDDGSTDGTRALVCAPDAPWHRALRHIAQPCGGAGRARNAGIAATFIDIETALQRAHTGSRLTDTDALISLRTRIDIIERNGAGDVDFQQAHAETCTRCWPRCATPNCVS